MHEQTVISHFGVAVLLQNAEGEQLTVPVPRNSGYVVGDRVTWHNNKIKRLNRKNELTRKTPFSPRQVMAANLSGVGIIVASQPKTPTHFIDATWVAACAAGIQPFIVVNKSDLADATPFLHHIQHVYGKSGAVIAVSAKNAVGVQELAHHIAKTGRCMFVGMSGAGKSSLTNLLIPGAGAQIGEAIEEGFHGRHTTSASRLLHLPEGGELIDTPGVRDFKPADVTKQALATYFVGFETWLQEGCRFRNCLHDHEPGCVIREALADELIASDRYAVYQELLKDCMA